MLTNRHHPVRWSLEQNQEVPVEDAVHQNTNDAIGGDKNEKSPPSTRKKIIVNLIITILIISICVIGFKVTTGLLFGKERSNKWNLDDLDNFSDSPHQMIIIKDHHEQEAHGVLLPVQQVDIVSKKPRHHNYAFVTLFCDNSVLENIRVLAYALQRTKSAYPLVVMALPFVTDGFDELIALGAIIEKVPIIATPFKRKDGKRPAFKKMCKFSKIHAWALIKYTKLVYLDPALLVVNNIDEIFQYNELSAVKVVGDDFNMGLFVLEPSHQTHQQMLKSYLYTPPNFHGEQGFFNWYFSNRTTNVISARYNTVLRQKDYAVWPLLRRNAKVFHFVPSIAPWNFYYQYHAEWEMSFEPIIFYYWQQMHWQALQQVQQEEFSPSAGWTNAKRALDICAPQSTSYSPKKFVIQNKFSILIGTWDRVSLLRKLILHYQKSRLVHKIYVTWHNPTVKPPENFIQTLRKKPPVEILSQKYDSLNNRFNPIPNLETRAVLICDDDIRVNITDIEYAFDLWKSRPYSLVGTFPRYHSYNAHESTYNYEIRSPERPRIYSIMLTKFMFINAEFLYIYTCLLPLRIHRYIDDHLNCEDIAMNLMVSGMTGSKPTAIMMHVDDFGTTSGISTKSGHLSSRSQCMTDLVRLFGRDTLLYNREVFLPFRKKKAAA